MKLVWIAWILCTLAALSSATLIDEVSADLLSILEILRTDHPAPFDCTIYRPYPNSYADDVVQRLLTSSAFAEIPVLQTSGFITIRNPSLVIVFLEFANQV